eukprot:COSAG01_NODE_4750_length_4766_cov_16.850043_2_plen_62_part_00
MPFLHDERRISANSGAMVLDLVVNLMTTSYTVLPEKFLLYCIVVCQPSLFYTWWPGCGATK